MSLYKRKDSPVWWINLSVAGRKVQKSTGITLRRKAQEVHDQLANEMWQEARLGIKSKYSWAEAVERWLEEKAHKKSIATDREYLRWMQPHLQGKSLDSITRDDVERLIRLALKEKVQNSTVNRRMALLRAILRRAESDWEWIDKVPKFRFLKEPKGRVRFLTVEDAKRLLSELPEHLRVMTMFSLCTGLRQGNVKNLRWSQVDLHRGFAWVEAHEAKGGKAIPVPLTQEATTLLRGQQGGHRVYVFHYQGKPIRQVGTKAWRAALRRAGIENFRWHDLRHTWASWHIQNGTPLYALQELGGWSDTEMVKRYAHLTPAHLADYANRFASSVPLFSKPIGYDFATLGSALPEETHVTH